MCVSKFVFHKTLPMSPYSQSEILEVKHSNSFQILQQGHSVSAFVFSSLTIASLNQWQ